jgi:hypothetical protein
VCVCVCEEEEEEEEERKGDRKGRSRRKSRAAKFRLEGISPVASAIREPLAESNFRKSEAWANK